MSEKKIRASDYPKVVNNEYVYVYWPILITGPILVELYTKQITYNGKAALGDWVCAWILKEGMVSFDPDSPVFKTKEACVKVCDEINLKNGWNALEAADIARKSVATYKQNAKKS